MGMQVPRRDATNATSIPSAQEEILNADMTPSASTSWMAYLNARSLQPRDLDIDFDDAAEVFYAWVLKIDIHLAACLQK